MARFISAPGRISAWGIGLLGASLLASKANAQSLETLPQAPLLPPFAWFASTDKNHKNADYLLLKPGETRRVPLAAGTLERLWSTSLFPDQTEITLEAGANRRQILLLKGRAQRGLLAAKTFTFFPALGRDPLARLEKGAALVVTNRAPSDSKWFFQAAVRPVSKIAALAKPKSVARRLFKIGLAPGESKVVETFASPGEITEFSIGSDLAGAAVFRQLRLKIRFDGQNAVDAPLLALAGEEAGDALLHNAVADFDGSRLVLRWPMPFERAEIALQNTGDKAVKLDVGARVSAFEKAPSPFRFCAQSRSDVTKKGQPVEILNLDGAGAFVGLSLAIAPGEGGSQRTFAFLEGNETIRSDGQTFEGTGTEDFFSSAWYFPDQPFFRPYEGLTQKIAAPPSVSAYRLLIPDAIPFQKSLRFSFEQGNHNSTDGMNWRWTAFWYQKPPLSLAVEDAKSATTTAPTAPNDRWKIGLALGGGVILGVVSALNRRRKRVA